MTNITWTTEKRKVSELNPAEYNPRKITEKEREDLMESIKQFGEVEPVVINTDNRLIGGHQRLSIYADLGVEEIVVRVPSRELTADEELQLNLRLNKNVAGWDFDKLQGFNIDTLLNVGFGNEELSIMWDNVDSMEDGHEADKARARATETKIQRGEIYALGEHRLMCGDSRSADDVAKLMDGKKTGFIYADAPQGVKDLTKYADATRNNMVAAMKVALPDAHVFYWCDQNYIFVIQTILAEFGVDPKRVCMWIKNNFPLTPQIAFSKAYDPCIYGTTGLPYLNNNYKTLNEVLNKEVSAGNQVNDDIMDIFDVWTTTRNFLLDKQAGSHKPVSLHEKAIRRCSEVGSVILDLFGGTGSMLIACQELKRKAYTMDKDPIACQVIINRWESYAGQKAEKIS